MPEITIGGRTISPVTYEEPEVIKTDADIVAVEEIIGRLETLQTRHKEAAGDAGSAIKGLRARIREALDDRSKPKEATLFDDTDDDGEPDDAVETPDDVAGAEEGGE